ncbi:helix-hairpin-helix domain-containing protein [Orbus wheelerorum]|uniref:ComEA family DNA-binding protein n=1 Tax=Orbus wheelerorum TaxID=3074111 RepID=UPI00370D4FA2
MKNLQHYVMISVLFLSPLFYSFSIYAKSINNQTVPIIEQQKIEQINININQSSAEDLARNLNGIGLNKAKKIVEYREKFGPFVSIEQLKEVSGIGQSILDANVGKLIL